ncbi:MAG: hypothetical protein QOH88_461 [Verrucomicrobiota bacterium]|jgi:hypothetical protein
MPPLLVTVLLVLVAQLDGASALTDSAPLSRAIDQNNVAWIDDFFQDYAEAFRSKSTDRLLAKFYVPLTFLTKDGPIAFNDQARLMVNLDALMRRYERIGAIDWSYTINEVRVIGDGIHLVRLEWRFLDARHELLYACVTSYILAGDAKAGAKVMAVIAHNENEEYEKALKRQTGAEATPTR